MKRMLNHGSFTGKAVLRLLASTLIFLTAVAHAQFDAYSIQVAVSDRSVSEQQEAYVVAMRTVLLANSGDKTLLNRNDVREGLRQAETYIDSFSFNVPEPGTVINSSTPVTSAVRSSGQATQLMLVRFNQQLIDELIQRRDRPAVAEDNPDSPDPFQNVRTALLWMLVDDGGNQTLIGASEGRNVMQRAREIAGGSGISLLFPAADDTDRAALSADDIRTADPERLALATARYAPPVVLTAHLVRSRTGGWEGLWSKLAGQQVQSTSLNSRTLDNAIQDGLAWLSPNAASGAAATAQAYQYGGTNRSDVEALVWVSPLRSTASYAEVLNFLDSIDDIETVYPKEVLSGGMVFAVLPRSAISAVSAAAATRNWLQQAVSPASAGASQFAGNLSLTLEYVR